MARTDDGSLVIAGRTEAKLGKAFAGATDIFAAKLDPQREPDEGWLWVTQIGSVAADADFARAVALDAAGNVYVAGHTTGGLDRANRGGHDAFVAKFAPDGAHIWTGQFGTAADDFAYGVAATDSSVTVVGQTRGDLGGVNQGAEDAVLATFSPDGERTRMIQFGTAAADGARAVAADSDGNVIVVGHTGGDLFGSSMGADDAFAVTYAPGGSRGVAWQLGTDRADRALAICIDAAGRILLAGNTEGDFAGAAGQTDVFVTILDPAK